MGRGSDAPFGWAAADLVRLDQLEPGVIARVLMAGPRLRHAIYLAVAGLGAIESGEREEIEPELARAIRHQKPHAIITQTVGTPPDGLMGALDRLADGQMSSPSNYLNLFDIYAAPPRRATAALIGQLGAVTEKHLKVIDALDPAWRLPEVVIRLDSALAARDLNRSLAMVQAVCSNASDEVVAQSIRRLPPQRTLADLVERFLLRADRFPDHPVREDDEIRPLTNGRDFLATGLKYRNCLRERIEDALAGRAAYADFRGEAIIEFQPLAGGFGWIMSDTHGPRNSPLDRAVCLAAQAKCLEIGIPHVDWRPDSPDLRRMCRFLRSGAAPA